MPSLHSRTRVRLRTCSRLILRGCQRSIACLGYAKFQILQVVLFTHIDRDSCAHIRSPMALPRTRMQITSLLSQRRISRCGGAKKDLCTPGTTLKNVCSGAVLTTKGINLDTTLRSAGTRSSQSSRPLLLTRLASITCTRASTHGCQVRGTQPTSHTDR